jgi:hypothetical protein
MGRRGVLTGFLTVTTGFRFVTTEYAPLAALKAAILQRAEQYFASILEAWNVALHLLQTGMYEVYHSLRYDVDEGPRWPPVKRVRSGSPSRIATNVDPLPAIPGIAARHAIAADDAGADAGNGPTEAAAAEVTHGAAAEAATMEATATMEAAGAMPTAMPECKGRRCRETKSES